MRSLPSSWRSAVLDSGKTYKEKKIMRKTAFALIAAVVILSGCATLSDTTDRACDSVVLNWLCGDA